MIELEELEKSSLGFFFFNILDILEFNRFFSNS
jgi:hypothetical protein